MAKILSASHYLSELKTKERLLSSIHKISSLLTRPISVDKILTCIVEETAKVFGFVRVGIFLTNKDKGLLECKYLIGFNSEETERALTKPYRLADHDCMDTKVARYGKTIYSRDMVHDPRATPLDLKISQNMKRLATIIVPLKIKQATIGLIVADRRDQKLTPDQKGHRFLFHLCQPGQRDHRKCPAAGTESKKDPAIAGPPGNQPEDQFHHQSQQASRGDQRQRHEDHQGLQLRPAPGG